MGAVNWEPVYRLVAPVLGLFESWPLVGSVEWCRLADDDPRKWVAVLDGGQHWALRIEGHQRALAEASKAVAASADWAAVSREVRQRAEFRKANPWAVRKAVR